MMTADRPQQSPQPAQRWPAMPGTTPHQAFIRSLPCLGCGKPAPSEYAHLKFGIGGDRFLVPLCGADTVWEDCCHSRLYFLGRRGFWSELGLDPYDLARALWRLSGDREAGTYLIGRARGRIAPRDREARP